jgi:tRNA-specific 2-thiouridylase
VLCNTHIKWEALLKRANMLDCEFIATGHYAQVRNENNRFVISKGLDVNKDQSYVLWGLTQQSLAKTQFPLGGFRKTDIRQMAIDMGYEELANKSESYEICFVPDNDYRGFLKRKVDGLEAKVEGGNFTNSEGKIIGKHRGYPFYTIGQRKGLEIAFGEPVFVLAIYPETNTVVLGREEELQQKGMWVRNINMGKFESVLEPMESLTKIRYKDAGSMANIHQEGDRMKVIFNNHVKAIAPGQSAVFYDGNDVIGGGWIQGSFDV